MALTDEREDPFLEEMLKISLWTWAKERKPSPVRRVKGRRSFELAAELGQGCRGESWVAEGWKDPECDSPASSLVCSSVGMQGGTSSELCSSQLLLAGVTRCNNARKARVEQICVSSKIL